MVSENAGHKSPDNHFATASRRQADLFATPLANISILGFLPPSVGERCLSVFLCTPRLKREHATEREFAPAGGAR